MSPLDGRLKLAIRKLWLGVEALDNKLTSGMSAVECNLLYSAKSVVLFVIHCEIRFLIEKIYISHVVES